MSASKRHYKCCVLGCTNEHRSLHTLPPSELLRTRWLNFIFKGTIPEKIAKVKHVCANHFTPDCLTNKGQFNAGFSQRLILKEGSIPTLRPRTSDPDKVSIRRHILFSKLPSERAS